jgi:F0F1-type ATP synthase assembly protein I
VKSFRWRGAPSADNDALSHAMAMVAVPVVFGLVGWWVDSQINTIPVFLVLFAAFGVVCSFASAFYKYERRMADHDEGMPWMRTSRDSGRASG